MNDPIAIREIAAQTVAFARAACARSEIGATLARIIPEVGGCLKAQGATAAGPPFCRYIERDATGCVLEGGAPVATPITPSGAVEVGELPAGEVAFTTHHGPYDQLSKTYQAICEWMQANGRESGGAPWDSYITDPYALPDPADWRTEVYWPLR